MRKSTLALALAALMLTSGCLGFIQGDGALTFESEPATVSDEALEETGFDNETVTDVSMNQSFNVRDETREVKVTNWNVQYEKSIGTGAMAQTGMMFMTFSTPEFSILGQSLNPVGNMTNEELLEFALTEQEGVQNVTKVEDRNAVILSKGTNVTTFETTIQGGGEYMVSYEQDVYLHVTKVAHEGDYIIMVGVHPANVEASEDILHLMENVEHSEN